MAIMTPTYVKTIFGEPATVLYIDPPLTNKTHDDIDTTFEVNVTVAYVTDLQAFAFNLTWDDSLITLVNVNFTTTLNNIWGKGNWFFADNTTGVGFYALAALSLASSFNGTGPNPLCKLAFNVQDPQTNSARNCSIHFDTHDLSTSQPSAIAHTVADGSYTIAGREATVLVTPSLTEKTYSDVDATFEVNVTVESVTDLFGVDLNVTWDSAFLNFSNCYYNDTLDALWGSGKWFVAENESGIDYYKFVAVSTADSFNTTRSRAMFTLEFIVGIPPQPNETMIHFATDKLSDSQAENITHLVEDGTYRFGSSLTIITVGSGSVIKSPNQAAYLNGTVVTLTASPAIGWSFAGWSGDASGLADQTTVNMTSNKSVTATFTQNVYTFWITVAGQGSVNLNNSGPYHFGDVVQLSAVPAAAWAFDHWSGDLSGSVNPITLTINGNASVTATFTRTTQNIYTLTISVDGNGSVTLNKTGPYNYGDVVQLTATANASWSFLSWSGNLTGYSNPATLTMTGNFSVTAHFTQQSMLQMNPSSKICRMYGENFTVAINLINAVNVKNLTFEIRYNTTLLDYINVTWNGWGTGTINVNESGGIITGSASGNPFNGTRTLATIKFQATFQHLWKNATGWTNVLSDIIFIRSANLSYTTGPSLGYERGGLSQISVGPDFTYTFSPIQGDLNNIGTVDIFDLRLEAAYFDTKQGDPNWAAASTYDLNGDGKIDILDVEIVAGNYGYSYVP